MDASQERRLGVCSVRIFCSPVSHHMPVLTKLPPSSVSLSFPPGGWWGSHSSDPMTQGGEGGGGDVILLHISFFPLQLCFKNRFGWLKMFWLPNKHEFEGRVMAPCRPKSATSTITEHIGRDRVQLYSLSTAVFPVPQSSGQSKVMWKRRQEVNLWTFQVHHHSELDYKEHC